MPGREYGRRSERFRVRTISGYGQNMRRQTEHTRNFGPDITHKSFNREEEQRSHVTIAIFATADRHVRAWDSFR